MPHSDKLLQLADNHFQSIEESSFVSTLWTIVGKREVKKFFGLWHYSCPSCRKKIVYYIILFQTHNRDNQLVGIPKPLALTVKTHDMEYPLGNIEFGICPDGHEIIRTLARKIGDSEENEKYFFFYQQNKHAVCSSQKRVSTEA